MRLILVFCRLVGAPPVGAHAGAPLQVASLLHKCTWAAFRTAALNLQNLCGTPREHLSQRYSPFLCCGFAHRSAQNHSTYDSLSTMLPQAKPCSNHDNRFFK